MPIPSFFKSPAFLTGSGFVGSGAIGIGGGQIYEENFPPMNQTMSMKGFELKPIEYPDDTKAEGVRVKGNSWGCVNRLFKGVSFQHNDPNGDGEEISYTEEIKDLPKEKRPIGCALMKLHPILEDGNKNYFYFRSEFVIKGENVGWVLLVVMSSSMKQQSAPQTGKVLDAYFLHRLIFLKKEGSDWKIKEGYGGTGNINTNTASLANEKAIIKSPEEIGFNGRSMTDTSSVSEKKGFGIGEESGYYGNSILRGVEAYINSSDRAEVLGSDGKFSLDSAGYKHTSAWYKDGKGGVKPNKLVGHKDKFLKGYEPFKDLKGRWSELKSRCQSVSESRHAHVSEDLKSICGQAKSGA